MLISEKYLCVKAVLHSACWEHNYYSVANFTSYIIWGGAKLNSFLQWNIEESETGSRKQTDKQEKNFPCKFSLCVRWTNVSPHAKFWEIRVCERHPSHKLSGTKNFSSIAIYNLYIYYGCNISISVLMWKQQELQTVTRRQTEKPEIKFPSDQFPSCKLNELYYTCSDLRDKCVWKPSFT